MTSVTHCHLAQGRSGVKPTSERLRFVFSVWWSWNPFALENPASVRLDPVAAEVLQMLLPSCLC